MPQHALSFALLAYSGDNEPVPDELDLNIGLVYAG
jgi:hypothetical protein